MSAPASAAARGILLIGGNGALGRGVVDAALARGLPVFSVDVAAPEAAIASRLAGFVALPPAGSMEEHAAELRAGLERVRPR